MSQQVPDTKSSNPWPGPRPYEVEEGFVFFGRDDEIDEIRRMILRERLTIVSAGSGAGKTSMLRAGLIFRLQRERRKYKNTQTTIPPVLLFREWGGGISVSIEELFNVGLKHAIDAMQISDPEDHLALSEAFSGEKSFLDNILEICEATKGIILIFDQFEEVLRAGEETANAAITMIQDIYRSANRVRIILSLRSEYHKDLHALEALVGGLYTRTYFLEQMVAKNAREAIEHSARAKKITVEDSVIQEILGLLVSGKKVEKTQDSKDLLSEEKIDLLTLQAILRELFEHAVRDNPDSIIIDNGVYTAYKGNHKSSELVGEALSRWINNSLNSASTKSEYLSSDLKDLDPNQLTGIVRRIASRMAQHLSSGSYKIAQVQTDLMFRTLRTDFSRLKPQFEKTSVDDWKTVGNNPAHLEHGKLGLSTIYDSNSDLSGLARELEWSSSQTADNLVSAFFEALNRLRDGNIIKTIRIGNDEVWELVHDGIGKPFIAWSERQVDTWNDNIYSLTAAKGISILITGEPNETHNAIKLKWSGCQISSADKQILENYEFIECDLRGSIFEGCEFKGGRFIDCNLDAVLFLNCDFEPGKDGSPFVFEKCRAATMTILTPESMETMNISSEMDSVEFNNCDLNQVKFAGIKLKGNVVIGQGSNLLLCNFARIEADTSQKNMPKIIIQGGKLSYCAWDKQSAQCLAITNLSDMSNSGTIG